MTDAGQTGSDTVWIEANNDALGINPDAQVAYSNGKLFRISASGSLLELGEIKALASAGKIVKHSVEAPGRVRVPAAAFR